MGYLSDCSEAEIDEMCRALGLEEVVKSNAGDLGKSEYSFRRGTPADQYRKKPVVPVRYAF